MDYHLFIIGAMKLRKTGTVSIRYRYAPGTFQSFLPFITSTFSSCCSLLEKLE